MDRVNHYSQTNSYLEPDEFSIDSALLVAQEAAYVGGKVVRERFGKIANVSWKRGIEIQTAADVASEQIITAFIKDHFSEHNVLGEELGMRDRHSPYTWIIDPLDGTNNFVIDIPQFAVCVSLKKHDEILLSVIHQPISGITYTALKGKGELA